MENEKQNIPEDLDQIKKLVEELHQHLSIQDMKLNHIVNILQEK